MFSDVSAFSPQYVAYPLICMVQSRMPALFSIVLIRVDAKNKALKVFCIWPYAQRKEFFHRIVSLYYLGKLTRQIIVKRLILVGQKRPCARWDYRKVVHYATLWMTLFNVQDINVFLAYVCEWV